MTSPELLDHLVEDRVAKVLAQLVTAHRNGKLTAQEALSGIASISALRFLPSDFAAHLRKEGHNAQGTASGPQR